MSQKTFKTPKGTELVLSDIKGKPYLNVQQRLIWFREEHPDWGIVTEYLETGDDYAFAKATITTEQGYIVQTAHKYEDKHGFGDFLEKAETGAIGRALGNLGYGTQFACELEEGVRIVDAPSDQIRGASGVSSGGIKKPLDQLKEVFVPGRPKGPFPSMALSLATEAQRKRLWAMAKEAGYNDEALKETLKTLFSKTSTKELTQSEVQILFSDFENKTRRQAPGANPDEPSAPTQRSPTQRR